MIVIGDLYQLPLVVTRDEAQFFTAHYRRPYFSHAHAFEQSRFHCVELQQVYRQSSPDFIALLDAVRTCAVTDAQLAAVNSRVSAEMPAAEDTYMHLMTTNAMANQMNAYKLGLIAAPLFTCKGTMSGTFDPDQLPTSLVLPLKTGARVMLVNNDKRGRWVNGGSVTVASITGSGGTGRIRVALADEREAVVTPG
jgi:ATP-dependent DNA helicase PIF1